MAFTMWDPLRDLLAIQERIDPFAPGDAPGWRPAVDLVETTGEYVLAVELPGLSREQVEIHFHDGHLVLRGFRPGSAVPCEQYHRIERGHGPFARSFKLPEAIDPERITADLLNGVLTITVPKAPGAGSRRVPVD